jgi:predicted transcriptional regulator
MPLPYRGLMKKDTSVNVRLTSELKAELQQLADRDSRKLSAYIELVLCAHVAAQRAAAGVEPSARKNAKAR